MSGINNGIDVRNLQLRHQMAVGAKSPEVKGSTDSHKKTVNGDSFSALMERKINEDNIRFSKHAKARIEERGINVSDRLLKDLDKAVESAREKGAKDTVIIGSEGVFLVNVPNNVVITTMTQKEMKSSVFTNIDSAVLI